MRKARGTGVIFQDVYKRQQVNKQWAEDVLSGKIDVGGGGGGVWDWR